MASPTQPPRLSPVGISPYVRRLRERIGDDLLLMPAVSVLVWDDAGRLLLVRGADTGTWQTIGGAVEPEDGSPWEAARREAAEEAGVEVELTRIRAAIGGPRFRHTYPNGDRVGFVSTVFDARILTGTPAPDRDEVTEVAWLTPAELAAGARDAPGSPREEAFPRLLVAILDAAGAVTAAASRGIRDEAGTPRVP